MQRKNMRVKRKLRHEKHHHYPPVRLRPDGVIEPEDAEERRAKHAQLILDEWQRLTVEQKLNLIALRLGLIARTSSPLAPGAGPGGGKRGGSQSPGMPAYLDPSTGEVRKPSGPGKTGRPMG